MRKDLEKYAELKKSKVLAGGVGGMGGQTSVDVEIIGYDFDVTNNFAQDLSQKLLKVKGIASINNTREDYAPEYQVEFDREKLALHGLNMTTVATYLRNRINGSTSSYYREDGDEYDITVRYAPTYRQSIEDIENIVVYDNQGKGYQSPLQ